MEKMETYVGVIEVNENEFHIIKRDGMFVYGTACNVGLLESGHCNIGDYTNKEEALQEFIADIEEKENGGIPSGLFMSK